MYDMYPWDSASQGDYPPRPLRSWRNPARKAAKSAKSGTGAMAAATAKAAATATTAEAPRAPRDVFPAQAVQVALDRRDNGGDAQSVTQSTAAPAASQARQ
jgi:hypothetical protein